MGGGMKTICVIDGQGGGIGSAVIKKLKERLGETVRIVALGTNAVATAQMLKAGANCGASGENAIVRPAGRRTSSSAPSKSCLPRHDGGDHPRSWPRP